MFRIYLTLCWLVVFGIAYCPKCDHWALHDFALWTSGLMAGTALFAQEKKR